MVAAGAVKDLGPCPHGQGFTMSLGERHGLSSPFQRELYVLTSAFHPRALPRGPPADAEGLRFLGLAQGEW